MARLNAKVQCRCSCRVGSQCPLVPGHCLWPLGALESHSQSSHTMLALSQAQNQFIQLYTTFCTLNDAYMCRPVNKDSTRKHPVTQSKQRKHKTKQTRHTRRKASMASTCTVVSTHILKRCFERLDVSRDSAGGCDEYLSQGCVPEAWQAIHTNCSEKKITRI